jgi:hypothetical protein
MADIEAREQVVRDDVVLKLRDSAAVYTDCRTVGTCLPEAPLSFASSNNNTLSERKGSERI